MFEFFSRIYSLLIEAGQRWASDNATLLAAGLAFYTVLSIGPLLLLTIAIASIVFAEAAVEGQVVAVIGDSVGNDVATLVENIIRGTSERGGTVQATVISSLLLLYTASRVFNQLKWALNTVWGIVQNEQPLIRSMVLFVQTQLLSFLMVLMVGFFLLLSISANATLTALGGELAPIWSGAAGFLVRFETFISFGILILLFGLLFRFLPDATIEWRDVWLGAVVTAVLFSIGEFALSLYLVNGSAGSAYGAAGAVIVILIWVFYSAQIILYGAEFTFVYAKRFGSRIKVDSRMRLVERGIPVPHPPPPPPPPLYISPPRLHQHRGIGISRRRQLATGLFGLAFGLFIAYVRSMRK